MNLAFQDAELLAELVETAKGRPDKLDEACRLYSAQRRRQVERVLRLTHAMGMLGALEGPALIRIREALIRICNRSGWLKRLATRRVINVG